MLFVPILMDEPYLAGTLNFTLVNPMSWESHNQISECRVGRRSMWYMPIGSSMLYGVLLDVQLENKRVGLGYIIVKRIDDLKYDVLLQDNNGEVLFAARGELTKIDKSVGMGTLVPLMEQEEVKKIYKPKWEINPEDFILFKKS